MGVKKSCDVSRYTAGPSHLHFLLFCFFFTLSSLLPYLLHHSYFLIAYYFILIAHYFILAFILLRSTSSPRPFTMSTNDKWQQLQYRDRIVGVKVYPGTVDTQEIPYVLVEDIQDHFEDATKFTCGPDLVSFMRDTKGSR